MLQQLNVFADEDMDAAAEALNDVSLYFNHPFGILLGSSLFVFWEKCLLLALPLYHQREKKTLPSPIKEDLEDRTDLRPID